MQLIKHLQPSYSDMGLTNDMLHSHSNGDSTTEYKKSTRMEMSYQNKNAHFTITRNLLSSIQITTLLVLLATQVVILIKLIIIIIVVFIYDKISNTTHCHFHCYRFCSSKDNVTYINTYGVAQGATAFDSPHL